jgi:hypothetical protein
MSEPHDGSPSSPAQPRRGATLGQLLFRSPLAYCVFGFLALVTSLLGVSLPGRPGESFWHSPRASLLHVLLAFLPVLYAVALVAFFEDFRSHRRLFGAGTSAERRAAVLCAALGGLLGMLPPLALFGTPLAVEGAPLALDALTQMPGLRVKLSLAAILGTAASAPQLFNLFGAYVQLIGLLPELEGRVGHPGSLDEDVLRYQGLQARLRHALGFAAAILGAALLVTGAFGNLLNEARPSGPPLLPASFVLAYGFYFSGLLALTYLPAQRTLTAVGEVLADRLVRKSLGEHTSWKARSEEHHAVRAYLGLRGPGLKELQDGIAVLTPLVAGLSSMLLGRAG